MYIYVACEGIDLVGRRFTYSRLASVTSIFNRYVLAVLADNFGRLNARLVCAVWYLARLLGKTDENRSCNLQVWTGLRTHDHVTECIRSCYT